VILYLTMLPLTHPFSLAPVLYTKGATNCGLSSHGHRLMILLGRMERNYLGFFVVLFIVLYFDTTFQIKVLSPY